MLNLIFETRWQNLKSLIDDLTSWDIICKIWRFCVSMTLECKIWYMMVLCSMTLECGMIYDGFVTQWPLNVKYDIWWLVLCLYDAWLWYMIYNGLVSRWPLNAKYYIWRFCASISLEWEIWYMIVLYSMTLECKIWYWISILYIR